MSICYYYNVPILDFRYKTNCLFTTADQIFCRLESSFQTCLYALNASSAPVDQVTDPRGTVKYYQEYDMSIES